MMTADEFAEYLEVVQFLVRIRGYFLTDSTDSKLEAERLSDQEPHFLSY